MRKYLSLILLLCLLLCGCDQNALPEDQSATAAPVTEEDGLTVHFIDVGQADCALIECGGEYMLIDGGNRDDSQLVVSYLQQQGVEQLEILISTHAHEDHVGGLPAVLAVFPTERILAATRSHSSKIYDDFLYYADQQELEVEIPAPGDVLTLGGAEITILGPVTSYADVNDTSIVCRIDYGTTSFLFTGDMEKTAEADMLNYWGEGFDWEVDVLKVGHHGSDTSSGYRFLNELNALCGVISLGQDNEYGYPHAEPMARFRQAGMTLFRTDEMGTVLAFSDGAVIRFTWEEPSARPENADLSERPVFIGNKNSLNFHGAECTGLPAERNRVLFDTYDEAIDAGYIPCGNCLG